MSTQTILLNLIDPNPWQTRTEDDPAHIGDIRESIEKSREQGIGYYGFWQPLMGRQVDGRYQLPFGMTRIAAFKLANPTVSEFMLDVVDLTDIQMSDLAAAENARRKNLSAIETMQAIKRRMKDFKMTQLQAAAPFGYKDSSSVSNLLGLGDLPEPIQQQVHRGEMAERVARRLRAVARVAPNETIKLAERALKADPSEREELVLSRFDDILRQKGKSLQHVAWKLGWVPDPVSAEKAARTDKGEPKQVSACTTCEFHVKASWQEWCTNAPCYGLKTRLFSEAETARVSQSKKIARLNGEKLDGLALLGSASDYRSAEFAEKALLTKHVSLRVFPLNAPDQASGNDWVKQALGSGVVGLGTVDRKGLDQAIKDLPKPKKTGARKTHSRSTNTQGQSSSKANEVRRDADAQKRRAHSRASAEIDRLKQCAAGPLAKAMPANAALVDLIGDVCGTQSDLPDFEKLGDGWGNKFSKSKLPLAEKQRLAMLALLDDTFPSGFYHENRNASQARRGLIDLASELRTKLPKDWDSRKVVDYQRGDKNCWECGAESDSRIAESPTEQERGWVVVGSASKPERILCPEHAPSHSASKLKGKKASA